MLQKQQIAVTVATTTRTSSSNPPTAIKAKPQTRTPDASFLGSRLMFGRRILTKLALKLLTSIVCKFLTEYVPLAGKAFWSDEGSECIETTNRVSSVEKRNKKCNELVFKGMV